MTDEVQRAYILSYDEFQILAALCGLDRVFGFRPGGELSRPRQLETVYRLTQKGLILSSGSGLKAGGDLPQIFSVMASAANTVAVITNSPTVPDVCLYPGTAQFAMLAQFGARSDCCTLALKKRADLQAALLELGVLQNGAETDGTPALEGEDWACLTDTALLDLEHRPEGGLDERIAAVFDKYDNDSAQRIKRLVVYRTQCVHCCVSIDQSGSAAAGFSNRLILNWMEE